MLPVIKCLLQVVCNVLFAQHNHFMKLVNPIAAATNVCIKLLLANSI